MLNPSVLYEAITGGSVEAAEVISTIVRAIHSLAVRVLQWLLARRPGLRLCPVMVTQPSQKQQQLRFEPPTLAAARHGRVRVLEWLVTTHGCKVDAPSLRAEADNTCHDEVIEVRIKRILLLQYSIIN